MPKAPSCKWIMPLIFPQGSTSFPVVFDSHFLGNSGAIVLTPVAKYYPADVCIDCLNEDLGDCFSIAPAGGLSSSIDSTGWPAPGPYLIIYPYVAWVSHPGGLRSADIASSWPARSQLFAINLMEQMKWVQRIDTSPFKWHELNFKKIITGLWSFLLFPFQSNTQT